MIYLKTYFYADHEIDFIVANIFESCNFIDKYIINEFSLTHTGVERKRIGISKLLNLLPSELHSKIEYFYIDNCADLVYADLDEDLIHAVNEPVMRSFFINLYDFNDNDIIISVDADEIIYKDSYEYILREINKNDVLLINLNQFFYKPNYLWMNEDFYAPTVIRFKKLRNAYPCNIRYEGKRLSDKLGAHLSWCMNSDAMITKLRSYSHPQYRKFANKKELENAILNKTYPFDINRKFSIKVLGLDDVLIPSYFRQ